MNNKFLQLIHMMNQHKALPKFLFGFDMRRISDDTFADRTNLLTGWSVIMADTFGAERRIDDIDRLPD